jgi:hypothetical protein
VSLSEELRNSPDEATIGSLPEAIKELTFMLATCQTLYATKRETLTELVGNPSLTAQSAAIIGQAQRVKGEKSKATAEAAPL